jgi:hypothetical protein
MVQETDDRQTVSAWATGGAMFAATLMVLIGGFMAIIGLAAIINDDYFAVVRGYAFDLDTTAWGWIHLILGVIAAIAGFGLFYRAVWAGVTALFLAVLVAIDNFFFIPYAPFWSLLVIGLCAWVMWSLTRPGVIRT